MTHSYPSAAEILDVLKALSTGKALKSRDHISEVAGPLRPLQCVEGAMAVFRLQEEDWPDAIREAIDCVVSRGGNTPGIAGKFLRRILSLDDSYGSLHDRMNNFVQEEPEWNLTSKGGLENAREVLLGHLAGKLRTARGYPCIEPDPSIAELAECIQRLIHQMRTNAEIDKLAQLRRDQAWDEFNDRFGGILEPWGITEQPATPVQWLQLAGDTIIEPAYKRYIQVWSESSRTTRVVRGWEEISFAFSGKLRKPDDVLTSKEAALLAAILLRPKDDFNLLSSSLIQTAQSMRRKTYLPARSRREKEHSSNETATSTTKEEGAGEQQGSHNDSRSS